MITIEKKKDRFILRMIIIFMGDDLCVSLYGGDEPHIGAVALAVPHPALRTEGKIDASVSLMTVTGHKEDGLARKIAYSLASERNCTVSVSCGIHLENATGQEIEDILCAADEMLVEAGQQLDSR